MTTLSQIRYIRLNNAFDTNIISIIYKKEIRILKGTDFIIIFD